MDRYGCALYFPGPGGKHRPDADFGHDAYARGRAGNADKPFALRRMMGYGAEHRPKMEHWVCCLAGAHAAGADGRDYRSSDAAHLCTDGLSFFIYGNGKRKGIFDERKERRAFADPSGGAAACSANFWQRSANHGGGGQTYPRQRRQAHRNAGYQHGLPSCKNRKKRGWERADAKSSAGGAYH